MTQLHNLVRILWEYVREVSGENDYARYRARILAQGGRPLAPVDFYLSQQQHKYSRINRCC